MTALFSTIPRNMVQALSSPPSCCCMRSTMCLTRRFLASSPPGSAACRGSGELFDDWPGQVFVGDLREDVSSSGMLLLIFQSLLQLFGCGSAEQAADGALVYVLIGVEPCAGRHPGGNGSCFREMRECFAALMHRIDPVEPAVPSSDRTYRPVGFYGLLP